MFFSKTYSLRKSGHIFQTCSKRYQKKKKNLSLEQMTSFEQELKKLKEALNKKDRPEADASARQVETFCHKYLKKTPFEYTLELIFALILALAVATVVRQSWFELYEIPTGSMRPTFREQDHLTVSKLAFGINVPLKTEHFYFDPSLVQRTSVLIFSGDKIPFIDSNTTYFWLFPYKKRYIKRCLGKPGDSLYFYGGKLYGFDNQGNEIKELLDSPWMHRLEHVPFLTFEGRVTAPSYRQIFFEQMNKPIGRLTFSGTMIGEIFNGEKWVKDTPEAAKAPHNQLKTYSDFWGFRNFAMVRLLTKAQLPQDAGELPEGVLYLEIRHTPSLTYPSPQFMPAQRGFMVHIVPQTTYIPLQQEHLDAIMDHMYTARFVVKNDHAYRYSLEESVPRSGNPSFADVPDGTYEFYWGKAFQIGFAGIPYEVSRNNPLYSRDPQNVQKLFNLGIEMNTLFDPQSDQKGYYPQRYGYFRDGEFYLLGAPILKKEDPVLKQFLQHEEEKEQKSSSDKPYIAFKDHGPPQKENGELDKEFISTFGFRIPEKHYLVLGDNHAMSSDSRVFGFVPEQNLQGAPSLIIWPPSERIGRPEQKPYPIFNIPRALIWSLAAVIAIVWFIISRRKNKNILES